ncbi:MAG: polysaccharide deacetylase family protein [Verrucomicrobia bacterium]|nr:polysaccharide deacetylase family protein [Verrucomicrobiota bacterium]
MILLVAIVFSTSVNAQPLQRAFVVRPTDTSQYAPDNDPVPLWQNFLRAFDVFAVPVDLEEIGSALIDANLLVLPDIREISGAQRDAILSFLQRGGQVIMTGRTGQTSRGETRSLASSLGLNYQDLPTHRDLAWWVVVDEPGRYVAGIPRMQRMAVQTVQPVALANPSSSVMFWLSGEVAKPDYDAAARNSAVHVGSHGAGKFLWTGFGIADLGGDFPSTEVSVRLFENILNDFKGLPAIELSPWPFPFRTAIIYSMDVEERFGNMNFVHEIPGLNAITYFILTFSADLHQNILNEIGQNKDIRRHRQPDTDLVTQIRPGAEVAVHGDNHDLFRGQTLEQQKMRLRRTSDYIQQITGHRPIGFRPPEESYDFFTLQALLYNDFEYILGDNEPDRAQPRILRVGNQRMVQMAILNKDDVNLITQARVRLRTWYWIIICVTSTAFSGAADCIL